MVQSQAVAVLDASVARHRARIDRALGEYTRFSGDCPARLAEAIRYSLLGPGKRLRPRMVLLAAEACGGRVNAALPAACAVEMVHAYSLIHDDLPAMDDDELRRGRPTCHKAFGEAQAILAGDALLALALEIVARDVHPANTAARCCAELAHAAGPTALVGGQAADLAGCSEQDGVTQLEAIHCRKTGAMFRVSLRLGGLVAGADPRQLEALETYAARVGLAFQITDDLLDAAGDAEAVGKRVGKDRRQGRPSYPSLLGVEASRRRAERLVEEACQALGELGPAAGELEQLARAIPARDR